MFSDKISETKNPIIYVFLSMVVSSICYGVKDDFKELAIIIAGFFFISILYYYGKGFCTVLIIFFVGGLILNTLYYKIPQNIQGKIKIESVTSYEIKCTYEGKILVLDWDKIKPSVGQCYEVYGKVIKNEDKAKGIVGTVKVSGGYKLKDGFITKIENMKKKIYDSLEKNIGWRKAGLILSIAFGYSDYIDEEDKDEMKRFGVIHSISVSGLHVVTIYGFLRLLTGRKFGLMGMFLYIILTGCPYSSIRAAIMLTAVEGSYIVKRNSNSLSALCLSGIIILVNKPYSIFQASFILSYLATLGILLYNKKLNYKLYKFPDKIREVLSISLSAQIFTVPYIMYIFKEMSINFLLGNLVLVPLVNVIVITGNMLLLVYPFQGVFDFISYIDIKILKLFDFCLDILDKFSLQNLYGNEYLVCFYLLMLLGGYFFIKGYKKFIYLPAIYIFIMCFQLYSPVFQIKYYDEGAILITYKGERILMSNRKEIDIDSLSKSVMAYHNYRDEKTLNITGIGSIKSNGSDYILKVCGKK